MASTEGIFGRLREERSRTSLLLLLLLSLLLSSVLLSEEERLGELEGLWSRPKKSYGLIWTGGSGLGISLVYSKNS